jgi:hypothetical protein
MSDRADNKIVSAAVETDEAHAVLAFHRLRRCEGIRHVDGVSERL